MYDTHMSTPGNTAKLGATHSNIQTAQRGPCPWLGANLQCISKHTTESSLFPLCQPGINLPARHKQSARQKQFGDQEPLTRRIQFSEFKSTSPELATRQRGGLAAGNW